MAADPATQTDGAQEGAQEAQQGQEQQEQQPNAVEQRLDDLAGRFDSFEPVLNGLAEALQQPEEYQQEQGQYDQYGNPVGQPRFDPNTGQPLQQQGPQFYDPQTGLVDPQALNQHIEQMVQAGIQQGIQPATQQLTQIQEGLQDQKLDALAQRYPEMGDEEFLRDFAPRLQAAAQGYGNPELAFNDNFAEMVYLAGKAGDASSESAEGVPGGDGQAHVEGASSAQQQQSSDFDGDQWWERIQNAR